MRVSFCVSAVLLVLVSHLDLTVAASRRRLSSSAGSSSSSSDDVDDGSSSSSASSFSSSSSCNDAKDETSCFQSTDPDSGTSCVWCSCAAIPSECLTQDQSEQVPPGVFDCKSPSSASSASQVFTSAELSPVEATMDSTTTTTATTTTYTTMSILERMTWTEQSVDDDFCDSRSSSGYVSIDESTFDQDGENKHLFYWMFEKRNSDVTDTTIPLIIWLTGGPGCSSSLYVPPLAFVSSSVFVSLCVSLCVLDYYYYCNYDYYYYCYARCLSYYLTIVCIPKGTLD
jgi:hypothetical protein